MTCIECGSQMRSTRENRRYDAGGLPQVILLGLEVRRCPKCGVEEIVIPQIEQLHRVIAEALIRKLTRLDGSEIRYLRKYLGWSGADFARHLGTARETVSRWEKGVQPIGPQADRLLRLSVATTVPVKDYSTADLTRIDSRGSKPVPAQLSLKASRNRWALKNAA